MDTVTFLDASALVKLLRDEPESMALIDYLDGRTAVEASELCITEVGRAIRRVFPDANAAEALEGVVLHKVTPELLRSAVRLSPPRLRTLDAIHLATALSLGVADTIVITYDARMADAARAHGVRVVQPGR